MFFKDGKSADNLIKGGHSGHPHNEGNFGTRTSTDTFLDYSIPALSIQPTETTTHSIRCNFKLSKTEVSQGSALSIMFASQVCHCRATSLLIGNITPWSQPQQNVTFWDVISSFISQSESVSYVENKPEFPTNDSSTQSKH